jgi:quercetin dioxygenase-like cupin family protein
MYRVRQQDLPFQGSSHRFVGAENGDVNVSVFLLSALPGHGPGPHRHPYDEVQFVREGQGLWTVNGEEFEAGAGDILVIKAGEIHGFRCIGDAPLVQVDIHLSPRFIQENLPMATAKQKAAARRNIKKAAKAAARKKTIAKLPKRIRTALGKQGAKVAKKRRRAQ